MKRRTTKSVPVVFVRVGRLKYYDTTQDTERAVGGGKFNEREVGSEVENFRAWKGMLHGYAEMPSGRGFNLDRVAPATNEDDSIDGVLVVMVALAETGRGQVIVGWYRNALIYNEWFRRPGKRHGAYNMTASVDAAVLLPISERKQRVQGGKGGLGQANVFYLLDQHGHPRSDPWIREAIDFVDRYDGWNLLRGDEPPADVSPTAASRGQGRRASAEENKAVEMAAMRRATNHFEDLGYLVTDVSGYRPFDLLCERTGHVDLRVEVKGTTGAASTVNVTSGEVDSARSARTALFVVSGLIMQRTRQGLTAVGGVVRCIDPWRPTPASLRALQYEYRLPNTNKARS